MLPLRIPHPCTHLHQEGRGCCSTFWGPKWSLLQKLRPVSTSACYVGLAGSPPFWLVPVAWLGLWTWVPASLDKCFFSNLILQLFSELPCILFVIFFSPYLIQVELGLISYGCHNKWHTLGSFKLEKFIFSPFWRQKVHSQGVSGVLLPPKALMKRGCSWPLPAPQLPGTPGVPWLPLAAWL